MFVGLDFGRKPAAVFCWPRHRLGIAVEHVFSALDDDDVVQRAVNLTGPPDNDLLLALRERRIRRGLTAPPPARLSARTILIAGTLATWTIIGLVVWWVS